MSDCVVGPASRAAAGTGWAPIIQRTGLSTLVFGVSPGTLLWEMPCRIRWANSSRWFFSPRSA
jgi:hypothetical protein